MPDTYPGQPTGPDVSQRTIDAVKAALSSGRGVPGDPDVLAKATTQGWSIATGAVGLLLESPAKNLFPVLSPIRNWMSRHGAPNGASAVQWRAITGINVSGLKAGVADGLRNAVISSSERDRTQAFKSFGLDDFVTYDAQDTAQGFMDLRAEATANLLAAVMVEEEKLILGGNTTALGPPAFVSANITDVPGAVVGPLTAATPFDVSVTALTQYGYLNGATGHGTADSPDETQGQVLVATHTSGGGVTSWLLTGYATRGAVAYNVFIGTSGGTRYYAFTTTATRISIVTAAGYATFVGAPATYPVATYGTPVILAALPVAGNVPNTNDLTGDALSFDGMIPQFQANANSQYRDATAGSLFLGGGYYRDMLGAQFTADNANGINEIDLMLKTLWDTSRIGPTRIIVNSQEAESMGKLLTQGGVGLGTVRWNQQIGPDGAVTGGLVADSYRNKFTSPRIVPIEIHPYLAPGTVVALSERLPFPRTNVPTPFQLEVLREYTSYDWANVQRRWEFGVYGRECLKCYFPAGTACLVGVQAS
jgi:hypothetical protein